MLIKSWNDVFAIDWDENTIPDDAYCFTHIRLCTVGRRYNVGGDSRLNVVCLGDVWLDSGMLECVFYWW